MAKFGRSFGLQWHITNRCDQRCSHCYIWRGKEAKNPYSGELNLEQGHSVVAKFLTFCTIFEVDPLIAITGGDPLLCPWFFELLDYIHQMQIPFIILGNPFHLNRKICEKLKILGCRGYQMSLDGLREIHDSIRNKEGSFNATLSAIKVLQNLGIKTMIMSTVSCRNVLEIPKLAKLAVELGVDVYDFGRYCPPQNAIDECLSPHEYRDFLGHVWEVLKKLADHSTKFPLKDHLWRLYLYEIGVFQIQKSDVVLQGCNCGIRHLAILADGTAYACRRFESHVGNVLKQSFQEIFLGGALSRYREIKNLKGCNNCDLLNYCRGCHAVSYGVYGDFFEKDPQCWR